MNDHTCAVIAALAHIGIAVTPSDAGGWGWAIQNDKIVRDWQGPYPTPDDAIAAVFAFLLEYARKGLLCHHVHPPAIDDDPLAPWARAFQKGIPIRE